MAEINPITVVHPDSEQGVRDMLDANFTHPGWDDDPEMTPDPQVQGVWLVRWEEMDCIAYLAGHPDSTGRTRGYNDAEFGEAEPKATAAPTPSGWW